MDPEKVSAVQQWSTLMHKKGLQSFLGFCNFFQCFILNFIKITKPLSYLTGNIKWKWTPSQQDAFEQLKHSIAEEVTVKLMPSLGLRYQKGTQLVQTSSKGMDW